MAQTIDSGKCDQGEITGTVKVPGMSGAMGSPCMQGKNTAEDDWFRTTMCAKMKFLAPPDSKDPAKDIAAACESMRVMMLGNFSLLAAPPLDTTATRKKGNDVVQLTEKVSWFDNVTPVADFGRVAPQRCDSQPSDWQDEKEYDAVMADTKTINPADCAASWPSDFGAAYPRTIKGMYLYLMDQAWDEFSKDGKARNSGEAPLVRKDIRTLSKEDRAKYLNAIRATECLGLTRLWGAIHASSPADMHSGPGFLPSHSIFMRVYELSLQTFGGLGRQTALHIGGWPADETLPRWHNGRIRFSAIWGDDFIGPIATQYIGQEVLAAKSDVFSKRVPWATPSMEADSPTLVRSFRNVEQRGGYISAAMIWQQLAIEDHMQFACNIERSLLHGGHHMVISGHMGNLLAASWDAAFFMHHGFVDCVWRSWQLQGDQAKRALRTSYPKGPSWWSRHRPTDFAHWTSWTSPVDNKAKTLTHEEAYEYRSSGRGSYKCLIPSLLPCSTDQDCGVPAGQSREDKRLYCSVAGVCSQYVESNAICRNEYGAYLPCQKTTDRCQYVPSLYAKYNRAQQPANSDVPNAWFCVASPALDCGSRKTKSACTGECNWVDSTTGVQSCSYEVPAFGFGVVESASETMQALGAKFDFRDAANAAPSGATWQVKAADITATVTAVRVSPGGDAKTDSTLTLRRSPGGFGVADSRVGQDVKCPRGGGDFPDQIDRSEGIQIVFSQQVVIEAMHLSQFGLNDIAEVQIFDGTKLIAIQRYEEQDVVFGASTKADVAQACPDVDGRKLCRGTKLIVYHASAINKERSSEIGVMDANGNCVAKNMGAAFSLDNIVVSRTVSSTSTTSTKGTKSSFAGYCTGKPGGDFTHCQNQDVCYMSPPTDPAGRPTDVQIVLVPAGTCGPKGWVPQIDFVQGNDKITAKYKTECTCGVPNEVLKGKGPMTDVAGKKFRPLLDLYRVQDRAGGNDDANRMESPADENTGGAAAQTLAAAAALVALVATMMA